MVKIYALVISVSPSDNSDYGDFMLIRMKSERATNYAGFPLFYFGSIGSECVIFILGNIIE